MNITTKEEALETVKKDGNDLRIVPEKLKTYKVCLEAVKQNGEAINFVPEELNTSELFLIVIKLPIYLQHVPENLRTPEICSIAITQYSDDIEDVPTHIKEGNFKTDITDLNSLLAYVCFTPKPKQKVKYIETLIKKASRKDLNTFGDYISLKGISIYLLPLLTNIKNEKLLNSVKRKLSK